MSHVPTLPADAVERPLGVSDRQIDQADPIAHTSTLPEESPMLSKATVTTPAVTTPAVTTPALLHSTKSLLLHSWLLEILSACAALAVLVAVSVLLSAFDGRPNPLWTGGITLNTVVAFGSVLFRVSLMVPVASCISQLNWIWFAQAKRPLYDAVRFDQASRGLYGSMKLLVSLHVKTFAFLGAIVSVTSLGIGPFFQQCLVFYSAPVLNTDVVSYTSRAMTYDNKIGFIPTLDGNQASISDSRDELRVSHNLRSAIYNEFFSFNTATMPNPPFECSTGNCTWSPFPTLAVDVQCRDAPEQYLIDCSDMGPVLTNTTRECVLRSPNGTDTNSTIFWLPPMTSNIEFDPPFFAFGLASDDRVNRSSVPEPMGRRVDIQWVRVTDLRFTRANSSSGDRLPGEYITPNSTVESRRCKLIPCVHVIKAQVNGGIYKEEVIERITTPTFNPTLPDTVAYTADGTSWRKPYNITWQYRSDENHSMDLTLTSRAQEVIMDNFASPFMVKDDSGVREITVDIPDGSYVEAGTVKYARFYGFIRSPGPNQDRGSELYRMIYQTPNITDMVHSLAQRANIALRSVHTTRVVQANSTLSKDFVSDEERVSGLVWHDAIHVGVRWAWLALPISALVLVVVLLIATVWLSRAECVGIWKDDLLALLLFSRWDEQGKPTFEHAQTQGDIRRAADVMRAQLVKDLNVGDCSLKGTMVIERVVTTRK